MWVMSARQPQQGNVVKAEASARRRAGLSHAMCKRNNLLIPGRTTTDHKELSFRVIDVTQGLHARGPKKYPNI